MTDKHAEPKRKMQSTTSAISDVRGVHTVRGELQTRVRKGGVAGFFLVRARPHVVPWCTVLKTQIECCHLEGIKWSFQNDVKFCSMKPGLCSGLWREGYVVLFLAFFFQRMSKFSEMVVSVWTVVVYGVSVLGLS